MGVRPCNNPPTPLNYSSFAFSACLINLQCRSIKIRFQKLIQKHRPYLIWLYDLCWATLRSIPEIWSLLIRIDRHWGLIHHVLKLAAVQWETRKYTNPANTVRNFCRQKLVAPPCVGPNCTTQCTTQRLSFRHLNENKKETKKLTKTKKAPAGGA